MKSLVIFGKASQKQIKSITIKASDYKLSLMDLLQYNAIPVASSCNGEGICLKCIVILNDEKILSCQYGVEDIFRNRNCVTVVLSYL